MFKGSDDSVDGTAVNSDSTTRTELVLQFREEGDDHGVLMLNSEKWDEIRLNPGDGVGNRVRDTLRRNTSKANASKAVEDVYIENSSVVVRFYPGASISSSEMEYIQRELLEWVNENRGPNTYRTPYEVAERSVRTETIDPDEYSWRS